WRRELREHILQPLERLAALLLPHRPVDQQPVAQLRAVVGAQPLPDLARTEHIRGAPLAHVDVARGPPVIARRVPQREAAVDLRVDHETGVGGATGATGPRLPLAIELADV